jgi:hypothetical protein
MDSAHDGAAWAAILSAGIGCAAFGGLTDLAEASERISRLLNFYNPTGDLSGVSLLAIVVWLGAWATLHMRWKHRDISAANFVMGVTAILIVAGLMATFPPIVDLMSGR